MLYDPPSGWKYGFPKPYKPLENETLEQTLLRDGYPQREINSGGSTHVRFIEEPGDLETDEAADKFIKETLQAMLDHASAPRTLAAHVTDLDDDNYWLCDPVEGLWD